MDYVALALRSALFVIFATAGTAKLLDLRASRETILAFGVPEPLARPLGTLLPVAEMLTSVALLITATGRAGAIAAAALLVVFTAGVAYALSQGRTPDCNCFGQVSSAAISWRTLVRNALLIAVAAVLVWRGAGASLTHWTANAEVGDVVGGLSLIGLALAAVGLVRMRHLLVQARGELAAALVRSAKPGLQPGEPAPEFVLPTMRGEAVTLASLLERAPALLIFASQTCGPCMQMLPDLIRWAETLEERLTFALIESDVTDAAGLAEEISAHGTIMTLLDDRHEVATLYQVAATPSALIVGMDGRIATPHASGGGNIEELIRASLAQPATAQGAASA